jgi:RNA polymerase sigma-70 factor (ECF subfamily)
MADDEQALIDGSLRHDHRAFAEIIRRYERPIYVFVWNLTSDRHTSEDLVQETFVAAHRHLHRFDASKGSLRTWLFTIARRKCLNWHCKKRPRYMPSLPEPTTDADPAANVIADEMFALLDGALAGLPIEQRTAFTLFELQSLTYAEIAQIERVSLGTVKSRIARARTKLRTILFQSEEFR